ncbi:outer membrane lipid asymmetry maintenance protein MlaD [Nereida sp. MMG025]|uniref:outer membrane lipid asymmetry maintenance protein MlaD n=1 Tax=Nereida sp. MMG025 TaxID=2909981 RepID=UPI001F01B153|nr:outer membrane lipid asymmetry maintenance protein MlaD [Nereida sp. MMG025]MCF6443723.1 outer membrane lipid asymmetry maintenance protein MlaD [Nereida sp. MMG025]
MSDTRGEVILGGAVLAAAIGFLVYAAQATGFANGASDFELTASFRSAEGISVGTDVRMSGVKIGTVTGMELNPQTLRADTTFALIDGVEIPDDSAITISSEGLLGGNFVEIQPGGSMFAFEDGAEIEDTQGAVSLVSLLLAFVGGSDQ